MTADIQHETSGLLAAQVQQYADAIEQRDLARDVAVQLEGELHAVEIERDALIAQLHAVREFCDTKEAHALDPENVWVKTSHVVAVALGMPEPEDTGE